MTSVTLDSALDRYFDRLVKSLAQVCIHGTNITKGGKNFNW